MPPARGSLEPCETKDADQVREEGGSAHETNQVGVTRSDRNNAASCEEPKPPQTRAGVRQEAKSKNIAVPLNRQRTYQVTS